MSWKEKPLKDKTNKWQIIKQNNYYSIAHSHQLEPQLFSQKFSWLWSKGKKLCSHPKLCRKLQMQQWKSLKIPFKTFWRYQLEDKTLWKTLKLTDELFEDGFLELSEFLRNKITIVNIRKGNTLKIRDKWWISHKIRMVHFTILK